MFAIDPRSKISHSHSEVDPHGLSLASEVVFIAAIRPARMEVESKRIAPRRRWVALAFKRERLYTVSAMPGPSMVAAEHVRVLIS
jgi:hypothetical protein